VVRVARAEHMICFPMLLRRAERRVTNMAKTAPTPEVEYEEEISVPFDIEDVADLKIGQEVTITLRGCINRLDGSIPNFSCIGVKLYEKKLRKTGNSQAEGIAKLSGEDDY